MVVAMRGLSAELVRNMIMKEKYGALGANRPIE
jgi:hypothetical protein